MSDKFDKYDRLDYKDDRDDRREERRRVRRNVPKDDFKKEEKGSPVFDLDGIRQLVELMRDNNVSELDLEQGRSRLRLRRGLPTGASAPCDSIPVAAPAVAVAQAAAQVPVAASEAAKPVAKSDDSAFVKTINSPMVGTFYASPGPGKPAFVQVGDVVGPEKTVCIVEAMKVFNDIQAEISGKIVEVLVESGAAVEYGTPLFKVDVRG